MNTTSIIVNSIKQNLDSILTPSVTHNILLDKSIESQFYSVIKKITGTQLNAADYNLLLVGGASLILAEFFLTTQQSSSMNENGYFTNLVEELIINKINDYDFVIFPVNEEKKQIILNNLIKNQFFPIRPNVYHSATNSIDIVLYIQSLLNDAMNRDFTICALYINNQGQIFDPTGTGIKDLQARSLNIIGDAATKLAEDATRVLRAIKYIYRGFQPTIELDQALHSWNSNHADKDFLYSIVRKSLMQLNKSFYQIKYIKHLNQYGLLKKLFNVELHHDPEKNVLNIIKQQVGYKEIPVINLMTPFNIPTPYYGARFSNNRSRFFYYRQLTNNSIQKKTYSSPIKKVNI